MSDKTNPARLEAPAHINAEPHRRLMERLAKMTAKERAKYLFGVSVQAGIYTPDGELTEHYKESPDPTTKTA